MTRLVHRLAALHERGEKALICYVTAGDPSAEQTVEIVTTLTSATSAGGAVTHNTPVSGITVFSGGVIAYSASVIGAGGGVPFGTLQSPNVAAMSAWMLQSRLIHAPISPERLACWRAATHGDRAADRGESA